MTTPATRAIHLAAAQSLRYHPPMAPSQWATTQYHLSPQAAPEHPGPIDIWRQPTNVGIIDSHLEHKRGIIVQKCVQSAVSTYMVALLGYLLARHGGTAFYSLARLDTMRKHALQRIEPMIHNSSELTAIHLPGTSGNETIYEKTFTTGSLTLTTAASENSFISNAYRWAFADEFDKYGTFPSGADAWTLLKGRQANVTDPGLYGWSNPSTPDTGIHPHYRDHTDCRHYHIRCPHCHAITDLDFHRDVQFDYKPGTDRTIPGTARLHCQHCHRQITDQQRARAIIDAAQRTTPWYCLQHHLDPDPAIGWQTTLPPEEAAARPYAGFGNYSHLYNIRKPLHDLDHEYHTAIKTPAALKTFYNDFLGLPKKHTGQIITLATLQKRTADTTRRHTPEDTLYITFGADVQGTTTSLDRYFYYDISAWLPDARKITLDIGKLAATKANDYTEVDRLLLHWQATTPSGKTHRIKQAAIDAGYETKIIYTIANRVSPHPGSQWVTPIIYNHQKLGNANSLPTPQTDLGDPRRHVHLVSRNWLITRAIERVTTDRVELPTPLPTEVANHYTALIQVENRDRHGNMTGYTWERRQLAKNERLHDDYLQAAGYCEYAAILLGLDQLDAQLITEAKTAAQTTHRAPGNRSTDYYQKHTNSALRDRLRQRHNNKHNRNR